MQGEPGTTPLGNPVVGAGMIRRVVSRLLNQLEESAADYSVKRSYIELYNEGHCDLIAQQDQLAPIRNSQPMRWVREAFEMQQRADSKYLMTPANVACSSRD